MRSQLLGALVVTASLVFSPIAMAEEGRDGSKWGSFRDMSPGERESFHKERKAKWEALSNAEKLRMIEERRAEKRKEMDARWNAMSDAEKIRYVEERMGQKRDGKREGRMQHRERRGDARPDRPAGQ